MPNVISESESKPEIEKIKRFVAALVAGGWDKTNQGKPDCPAAARVVVAVPSGEVADEAGQFIKSLECSRGRGITRK